jgi:hypothetical protein
MHCDYQTDLQAIIIIKKTDLINVGAILILILIFGVLTPLSAMFQLYHGDQF